MENSKKAAKSAVGVILSGISASGGLILTACSDEEIYNKSFKNMENAVVSSISQCYEYPDLRDYQSFKFKSALITGNYNNICINGIASNKVNSNSNDYTAFVSLRYQVNGNMIYKYIDNLKNSDDVYMVKSDFLNTIAKYIKYRVPDNVNFIEFDHKFNMNCVVKDTLAYEKYSKEIRRQDLVYFDSYYINEDNNSVSFEMAATLSYRVTNPDNNKYIFVYDNFAYYSCRINLNVTEEELNRILINPSEMVKIYIENLSCGNDRKFSIDTLEVFRLYPTHYGVYRDYNLSEESNKDIIDTNLDWGALETPKYLQSDSEFSL